MTDKTRCDIFYVGDKMISRIILEDVLDEMIENICYIRLKTSIHLKEK